MTESIAPRAADIIGQAFGKYQERFKEITRRASSRFEKRDWHGMHQDALERLDLRERIIQRVVANLRALMGDRIRDKVLWAAMKTAYVDLINCRPDPQLAETFYSSVTRRVFATDGVDPHIEFVDSEFDCEGPAAEAPIIRSFGGARLGEIIGRILGEYGFSVRYQDLERDAALVAAQIERERAARWATQAIERIDLLSPVFYRGQIAYLIGRIVGGEKVMPLVLALLNSEEGIFVDAALLREDDISIIFSFTRSYFLVELERPREVVQFLHFIMPAKRIAELYISIGYHKHGKTELYRHFIHHLEHSEDQFEIAPGERGMVMVVFTLPSYDLVFKVIRDEFAYPKTTTREDVIAKYNLVFKHDRAGRLVDAQEFEHLQLPRDRFSRQLLGELVTSAPSSLSVGDDCVIIKHLYTERRVVPLNLFLREVDYEAARRAVLDFGLVLKDLAATNIFPGDLLLKNFGVTRHGRVIFYDYDELGLLSDLNFRDLPQPKTLDEEMDSEPWFYVGPNDVFPEEFVNFLGLTEELKTVFLEAHQDLFRPSFWREMQARHRAGEFIDILPYTQDKRLSSQPVETSPG